MRTFLAIAVVCTAVATASAKIVETPQSFRNPVVYADAPDPSVCCDGTNYYMVTTTMHFMPGAPIMRSSDMIHWKIVSHVFPRIEDHPAFSLEDPSGRTMYGQGQWATSIRYHKGKFYIWFVCNGFRGFIYTADRAEGPWRLLSRPQYRHDGSLFFDDDGRAYVFHGNGSVSELADDLGDFKDGGLNRTVVVRDEDEQALLEGSSVFKENGWYYLMMISMKWGEEGRFRREVCYRSRTLDSSGWEKRILIETPFDGHGGVGQGGVVKGPDGKYHAIIFQDRGGIGRTPNYLPVCWEDGWPMLGFPGADSKALGVKSGAARIVPNDVSKPYPDISGICRSDDFGDKELAQVWEWNHNPVDSAWSLSARKGWLRLKTPRAVPNLFLAPNTLTMRMAGPACTGVVKMDVSGMKDGDRAGLAAFQSDSAVLQVAMDGGKKRIVMTEERMKMDSRTRTVIGDDVKEVESTPLEGNAVWFRVRANFRAGQDWAETDWSADGKTWNRIGSRMPLRFDFTRFFTGSRFGIFNYATKASGGHVDVDFFDFSCEEHEGVSKKGWPLDAKVLDNVLVSQLDCGGWGKNVDKSKPFDAKKREKTLSRKGHSDSATIDNGATTTEIRYLLRYHGATKDPAALASAEKGLGWLLASQLPSGGWPQFPSRMKGYWTQITFNDNAMRNVLSLMHDADRGQGEFAALPESLRKACGAAFGKGLDCVLKCQIRVDGRPTVWCQQHDRETLAPVGGRAYELPSFCSQESAEMALFLMTLENPSPAVRAAIDGAVEWFRKARLEDGRWARFYDLKECRPLFCDRSGVPKRSIDEIDPERRKGYSWFNTKGEQVLRKAESRK